MRTKTIRATIWIVSLAIFAAGASSVIARNDRPIPICHRTASFAGGNQHDGYDFITVDAESIFKNNGHDSHDQQGNGPGGDIIPAFAYSFDKNGHAVLGGNLFYPGKNLDTIIRGQTGQTILENGCDFSKATATPVPSATPTPTPTATPTGTPKATPTPSVPSVPSPKAHASTPNTAFAKP